MNPAHATKVQPKPVVSYDFVLRRQMQIDLARYEAALRKAATTNEPLTDGEQELIWGTAI